MKPGLVLSDDQCNKRFGMKKDETIQDKDESKKSDDKTTEDINHRVVENEYAVLIDAEKSFDEQVKIGKPLFVSLLTRGTVSTVEEDDKDEDDEVVADTCSTLISDTLAMMISFQTERQLANARKFLPIKNILSEQGRVKIEDTLNILIQQIVLLMKQNKHFKSLSIEDQSELCQVNVMVSIVLSCFNVFSAKTNTISWPGTPPTNISLSNIITFLDQDIKEEMSRLVKFFETFSKLDIPRSAVSLLIFVTMFNHEFCVLEDKEAVVEARNVYIHLLYQSLSHSVGVRRACTLASKLHLMLQNLDRLCQILGQKFVSVA